MTEPEPSTDLPLLGQQLLSSAAQVKDALAVALNAVLPPPRRPADLVRELGLDKSLASRLQKAIGSNQPLEAFLEGAGVQGLRQALATMEKFKSDDRLKATFEDLRAAIDLFSRVSEQFPDGRTGLETVMAAHLPEMRSAAERRARRTGFQSQVFMLGIQQDLVYKAFIRVPSRTVPHLVDQVYIEVCRGFQVLRSGASSLLAGVLTFRADEPQHVQLTTLDGATAAADPFAYLIRDHCSKPLPPISLVWRGAQAIFALGNAHPALSPPVDLALGHVLRGGMRRFGTVERPFDTSYVILRKPVRTLVWDELSDPAIGSGPPLLTASFASGPGAIPASPDDDNVYRIRTPEVFESLGTGLDRVSMRELSGLPELLSRALEPLGIDAARLSVHRLRIEFPIPHTRYIVWNRLLPPSSG